MVTNGYLLLDGVSVDPLVPATMNSCRLPTVDYQYTATATVYVVEVPGKQQFYEDS